MTPDVFDFIHIANNSDLTNLQSVFKINNDHYPNVDMV